MASPGNTQEAVPLKHKTAKGLLWGGIGNGAMQVLNLFFGVFLARLLSPSDYGVVGALTIFYAIAGIFSDSGFILAIVNKKEVRHADYNAVFWFNVVMSASLYVVLFFCAPAIARFYDSPEMVPLSRFLFLTYVFGAVSSSAVAYYFRNLKVKERSRIQIESIILSGTVGVCCAYNGMGYWGLAIQTVIYSASNAVLLWWRCPWRPTLSSDFRALRPMLPFSIKQLVVALFQQFNNNMFAMMLGRFYGMVTTGFFTQGNKWTTMGYSTLNGMINGVGQPVLRSTAEDVERTRRVFRKLLRFTAFVSFPAMFGLGIVARELIVIAVSDKWLDSVPVMQILCVGTAFLPLNTLYGNLFNSIGRPNIYMWNTIALGSCQILGLILSHSWGLSVMLTVYASLIVAWTLVWLVFARRHIGYGFVMALSDVMPYLLMAAGAMALTSVLTATVPNVFLSLVLKIVIAAAIYVSATVVFKNGEFREALDFLRHRKVQ